jgi:hypothetical protein
MLSYLLPQLTRPGKAHHHIPSSARKAISDDQPMLNASAEAAVTRSNIKHLGAHPQTPITAILVGS